MEKSTKRLVLANIIIYTALLVVFYFFYMELCAVDTKNEPTYQKVEQVSKKKMRTNPLLEKSVSLCRNEYAREIANAALEEHYRTGYPLYVIYSLIATESDRTRYTDIEEMAGDFNPNADQGGYGCIGLLQVSPKWVLPEYNKKFGTNYTKEDLYKIDVNLKVGLWHFTQFEKVSSNYIEQYIIYNVGYSEYFKVNKCWFYGWDGKWYNNYRNSFFYNNDLMPPRVSYKKGLYGKKNKLPDYNARKRFVKYLEYYSKEFN